MKWKPLTYAILDLEHPSLVPFRHKTDRYTSTSGPRRSSHPMGVLLWLIGKIPIHHQRDVFDIQSSRTHVRANQDRNDG